MDTLIMVGQFILSLSILIILHECGHFFPAKWFNTKVEKFYLFFDPYFSLWKTKKGDTEYGIGWLPLGGYVKIAGMIDESFDKEQMAGPVQPWEFRAKPAWQRLIIMLGGVTVNFILGILLFAFVLFTWGNQYLPNENLTYGIAVDSLGYEMGLRDGDQILQIGEKKMERFSTGTLVTEILLHDARDITVIRDNQEVKFTIKEEVATSLSKQENQKRQIMGARFPFVASKLPKDSPALEAGMLVNDRVIGLNDTSTPYFSDVMKALPSYADQMVDLKILRNSSDTVILKTKISKEGRIGVIFTQPNELLNFEREKYSLAQALPAGYHQSVDFISSQIKAFGQMFKGKLKFKESVGGPLSIVTLFSSGSWEQFWKLTATLSILLGFMNLLPIPALDGGHVMFLLFEVVTGIKPSDKVIEYSTMVGFFILVALMIYVTGLDISRFF